ncbi:hypothetical protein BDFG_08037 [Blastomyces dermatitidis ATCC 26199]|nr:hypothetical protein BDFG_08037 [Blastomyces dermatitidis ATCC 26199]
MPQPRSFNDFLAYATIMLNEYPVIAEHLDHNSENIANAAKRIVELSHGLGPDRIPSPSRDQTHVWTLSVQRFVDHL